MTATDRLGNVLQDLAIKPPVRVASTGNITLSGLQTLDGIALAAGDRVLLWKQTDSKENGIWNASTGPWTRPRDSSGNDSFMQGSVVSVAQGSLYAGQIFECSCSDNPIIVGTSLLTFLLLSDAQTTQTRATSSSSLAIGTGSKTFATQAGKAFLNGQWVLAYSAADPTQNMLLQITSYSGSTLIGNSVAVGGAGTKTDWVIVLANSIAAAGYQPPAGTGNVSGPGSSTAGHIATFADSTGKVIQDGGVLGALAAISSLSAQYLATSAMAGGLQMINGTIVESHAGNAATFAIKTLAGADPSASDPVYMIFRDSTVGLGDYVVRTVTAALSITVPAGATLGASNGIAFRVWLVAFDDGGTVRLGVINCLSGITIYPLGQFPIASSTLTPANSPQVFYTTGAGVTSKAYAVLGYVTFETGLATAGTWNASPTRIQLFGPHTPLPGSVIQEQCNITGAMASAATVLPDDDSIPQNTEGDQYMTQAITPTSAANLLETQAQGHFSSNTTVGVIMALFRDAIASALAASHAGRSDIDWVIPLEWRELAGSTSATTYKIRAGASSGTNTFNGLTAARKLGGVINSFLKVREIMV